MCLRVGATSLLCSHSLSFSPSLCSSPEGFGVSFRLESDTLRVLERGEVGERVYLFFPLLCPSPRADQSPLDAVLDTLAEYRGDAEIFSCSGLPSLFSWTITQIPPYRFVPSNSNHNGSQHAALWPPALLTPALLEQPSPLG